MRAHPARCCLPLLILIGIALAVCACGPGYPYKGARIGLSQAIDISKTDNVQSVVVEPGRRSMTMTLVIREPLGDIADVDGNPIRLRDGMELVTDIDGLNIAELQGLGLVLPADYSTSSAAGTDWVNIVLYCLLFLLAVAVLFLALRGRRPRYGYSGPKSSFGRARPQLFSADRPATTFADVAGVEEAKQELQEVVDFLKSPGKFRALGARMPRGVLLVGPPGTGKTLLARAVAGESGVPFYSISGSEFVEMFVGVGASRVRDLFDQAKQTCPAIVFIDEIDSVGRRREAGATGSREEEQTLNQVLAEMDGFDPNTCVVVLAATNRPDVLDAALLRPGRFDRRVVLDNPDKNGRKAILKVHMSGKPVDGSVDLDTLATEAHGLSGADLANLANEAAILAARRNRKAIGMEELEESLDRIIAGPQRKSRKVSAKDRETSAYHEAGHALVARMLPNADPVHKISIVTRGLMGGYTRFLPAEERYLMTESQLRDALATLLAGHGAEEIVFNEVSTGPSNDIKEATSLARRMVTEYGMSDALPLRTFGKREKSLFLGDSESEERDYSEETARRIDDEVDKLLDSAHKTATDVLKKNRARLVHLAGRLISEETLEGPELEEAFTEPTAERPTKGKPESK